MWVRSAMASDLGAISTLLGDAWHATYDKIYGVERVSQITAEWHSVASLSRNLSKPNSEFLVADDGNQVCGMGFASSDGPEKTKLHQLYVHPAKHRLGVGKLLLHELFESFNDMHEMVLEVEERNENAVHFYRKHGFAITGKTKNCGKMNSNIPALIMTRKF